MPTADLAAINVASEPQLLIAATNIVSNSRAIFTQPYITADALRASACLPTAFKAVSIGGVPYWDGGYMGNPPLSPMLDYAQDLVLILVNAFHRDGMPPHSAPAILDRLNEITFNASIVLEINAIEEINSLLAELAASGMDYDRPLQTHPLSAAAMRLSWNSLDLSQRTARPGSSCRASTMLDIRLPKRGWARISAKSEFRSSLDVKKELTDKDLKGPTPRVTP